MNQKNVSLDNPEFDPMLTNLQANILKFHGRSFAYHLFFQFDPEKTDVAISWIREFANTTITSAKEQLQNTAAFNKGQISDGGTIVTLSLTSSGFDNLNIGNLKPVNEAFNFGLKHPDTIKVIKDNLSNWEPEFTRTIDMLIIIADASATTAEAKAYDVITQVSAFAILLKSQRGNVLKMEDTHIGIEHFGYGDGISQPMYLADEINNQSQSRIWDDTTALDRLLVEEKEDCFGSFLVFRKLEQNVSAFKIAEGDKGFITGKILIQVKGEPQDVIAENGKPNKELAGAMIVGRFENGTPVTIMSKDFTPNPHTPTNDFDYSNDLSGLQCPFHAHIRLVNPRKGDKNQDPDEIRKHRITRRGIPYDDNFNNEKVRIPDENILKITDKMLEDKQPTKEVGLLFMCYQSDIRDGFEELQGQWANTGIIDPATDSVGQDSLIAQYNKLDEKLMRTIPQQWGKPDPSDPFNFSGFIIMKGGEYFYTPSIAFLKSLPNKQSINLIT